MTRAQQTRVPAGVPTGGRFAHTDRPEADIELGTIPPQRGVATIDADRISDPLTRALVQIDRSVEHWQRGIGGDVDDLRLAALDDLSRGGSEQLAAMSPGAIHTAVRNIILKRRFGYTSGPDFEAWRKFDDLRRDEENGRGRSLTDSEQDDLAVRVRMSQAPGRRGKIGFHRSGVPVAVSIYGDDKGSDIANSLAADDPVILGGEDDPDRDTSYEEHVSAMTREIGRWQTYARYTGAPSAASRSISEGRAADYRRLVRDAHGAREVAADYLNGRIIPGAEVEKALFAPFGDMPEGQRRSLAAQLARLPRARAAGAQDPAHMLWDDAVRVATATKPRKSNGGLR